MAGTQNTQVVIDVPENTGKGKSVGEPVVAFDRDGDSLLYSLGDVPDEDDTDIDYTGTVVTVGSDTYTSAEADGDVFMIDVTTGQIKVEDKDALNFEFASGTNDDDAYVVRVTATDPSGAPGSITVIIRVTDVNEAPVIGDVTGTDGDDDNAATNPSAVSIDEQSTAIAVEGTSPGGTVSPVSFTANDPDTADATDDTQSVDWSAAGPDGGKFKITSEGPSGRGVLTFDKAPSYESPGDADKDNVYEVDVVAASTEDGVTASSKKRVKVTITNIEETGEIDRMSQRQPVTGIPIVALEHTDKDGGVKNRAWTWYRALAVTTPLDNRIVITGDGTIGDGADSTLVAGLLECADARVEPADDTTPCEVAEGSASYTPVDNDAGYTLYAVVRYTDGHVDPNPIPRRLG